jgi:tripeptidyl-peptidase I
MWPSFVGAEQFGSGGGISASIPRDPVAAFQATPVESYLRRARRAGWPFPPATAVDASGRATPDVATLGEGYVVVQSGVDGLLSGTSASAPAFAAMVSLLNEARLQRAGRPMGFLNPWLYQHGSVAFRDIVGGTNALVGFAEQGSSAAPMAYGWNATVGWDAVTGLGVPDFQRMLEVALSL